MKKEENQENNLQRSLDAGQQQQKKKKITIKLSLLFLFSDCNRSLEQMQLQRDINHSNYWSYK